MAMKAQEGLPLLWISACGGPQAEVIGLGERTDRVDLRAHLQQLVHPRVQPPGQGEIHGSPGAVGRGSGRIGIGRRPEPAHIGHDLLPCRRWLGGIDVPLAAELAGGVLHHERLHGQRPPGVKNRQTPVGMLALEQGLSLQQPPDHPLAEAERAGPAAVGRAQGGIGMGFQAQQIGRQSQQGFTQIGDRPVIPGTSLHEPDLWAPSVQAGRALS